MTVLRTLLRVVFGFILACIAAGLVQVLFVWTPAEIASVPSSNLPAQATSTAELALLTATHFAIFSAAFALIAAGIAEWLTLRGVGYWLAAGMGIALLGFFAQYSSEVAGQPSILNNYALQAYLTAGLFGGLVYWVVAGSHSGHAPAPETAPAGAAESARPRIIVETQPRELKQGSLAEKLALKRANETASRSSPQPQTTSVPVTKTQAATASASANATSAKSADESKN